MSSVAEIYLSTDCETEGHLPGMHSMLSFASAAFKADGTMVSTFSANLERLPEAVPDPETMVWWSKQPKAAWDAHRENLETPEIAMHRYVEWIKTLPGKPVFVAFPAGFDFTFVYWYLIRFVGKSPFGFSALDLKTYAMAVMGCGFRDAVKRNMPDDWFDTTLHHTHVALDDAIEQGAMFCRMLKARDAAKIGEIRQALDDGRLAPS